MKTIINPFYVQRGGLLSLLILLLILCACESRSRGDGSQPSNRESTMQANIPPEDIRHPAVAGSWYSDDPAELRQELEGYLAQAEDFKLGDIIGLVSPHAGYVYSGPVAAWAYRQVKGKHYDVVVIIAPSHVESFPFASIYGRGGYQMPFGLIPVDTALAQSIAQNRKLVKISDRGHRQEGIGRQEHSLEIQLPFLQLMLGDFKMIPIVMGDQSEPVVDELIEALVAALKGKNALLVASSDLSHYHPYDEAKRIDSGILKRVEEYDPDALLQDLDQHRVEACGGGPICTVMKVSKKLGADKSKVLRYATSGDVPYGDKRQVVGYLAAAFYCTSGQETARKPSRGDAKPLSLEEKQTLMNIARRTIESVVRGQPVPEFEVTSPSLLENRGAFVTIQKRGQLRGCIGYIIGIKPLYQTVREVAEAAALRDPRFDPVRPDELEDLDLEISALSVPRTISDVSEIEVGVHGIIIKRGYRQGLLLPQVATEYGWDRKTFLEHTCIKAGLPTDAWEDKDTEIQIFSAEVFSEKDIK